MCFRNLQNRSQKNPTLAKLRVDFLMFLLHGPMATYATPPISASLNGSWHLAMWVWKFREKSRKIVWLIIVLPINSNSLGIPYFRQTNATETSSWLRERGWLNTCLFPNHSTFRMQLSSACEYACQKSDAIAELPESHLFSGQKETIERLEQIPRSIHQTS